MNKAIAGWIVVGVVVLGGIWYMIARNNSAADTTVETQGTVGTTTLADILARAESLECVFTQEVTTGPTPNRVVGNFHIADGRIRGDFTTTLTETEETLTTHMIQNEGTLYVWSDISSQGFTIPAPKDRVAIDADPARYAAFNLALNYDCNPWAMNNSIFTIPTTVTFVSR